MYHRAVIDFILFINSSPVSRIDQARKHCLKVEQAQYVKKSRRTNGKLDHFMDLFYQQFLKDVISSGKKLQISTVVRMVIAIRLVSFYPGYFDEINYDPL